MQRKVSLDAVARVSRCLGGLVLALAGLPQQVQAQAQAQADERLWRVCITDSVVPPYLHNDPEKPGLIEHLLLDSARQLGLDLEFLRYPPKRCRHLMLKGAVDLGFAAPVARNKAELLFPMRGEQIDNGRRLAQIRMVWVKRADSALDWDGERLRGAAPESLLVGTRPAMRVLSEPLQQLGFRVDDSAFTSIQLLHKLRARRIDLAVAMEEEVMHAQRDPVLRELRVLDRPLLLANFYLVGVKGHMTPARQAQLEAWWTAIAVLREQEAYRARSP